MTPVWTISALDVKPQEGNLTDVVITAHWSCTGTQDGFSTNVYGTCSFSQPGDPFTPYDQLTQAIVLGWIQPVVTGSYEEHVNGVIAKQIADKIDPVTEPDLPWVTPTPTPPAP